MIASSSTLEEAQSTEREACTSVSSSCSTQNTNEEELTRLQVELTKLIDNKKNDESSENNRNDEVTSLDSSLEKKTTEIPETTAKNNSEPNIQEAMSDIMGDIIANTTVATSAGVEFLLADIMTTEVVSEEPPANPSTHNTTDSAPTLACATSQSPPETITSPKPIPNPPKPPSNSLKPLQIQDNGFRFYTIAQMKLANDAARSGKQVLAPKVSTNIAVSNSQNLKVPIVGLKRPPDQQIVQSRPTKSRRVVSWDDKFEALTVYKKMHGTCFVPKKFSTPCEGEPNAHLWPHHLRGIQLGTFVANARYIPHKNQEHFEKLRSIGLFERVRQKATSVVSRNRWVVLVSMHLDALKCFHQLHGHCNIPPGFIVPEDDPTWPDPCRGLPLDKSKAYIEDHCFELTISDLEAAHSIGLLQDLPPWKDFVQLLVIYQIRYGTNGIPLDFSILPEQGENVATKNKWPSKYYGLALGELAWSLGQQMSTLRKNRKNNLDRIVINFNSPVTWGHILDGLAIYKLYFGNVVVPMDFCVHDNGETELKKLWPKEYRGMALGYWKSRLEDAFISKILPDSVREHWEELCNTSIESMRWNTHYVALQTYKKVHHDLAKISEDYTIPFNSEIWPADVQGFGIGAFASKLTVDNEELNAIQMRIFRDLGVASLGITEKENDQLKALDEFKFLHGHLDIPVNYKVPTNDTMWSENYWGRSLGQELASLRNQRANLTLNYQKRLHKLGIVWETKDGDPQRLWNDLLYTLNKWKQTQKHVPLDDSMVLRETCWPESVKKRPFGYYLTMLMVCFDSAEHIQKFKTLGYRFQDRWKTLISALSTFYRLFFHMQIPHNFKVPQDDQWNESLWGLELGLHCRWLRELTIPISSSKLQQLDKLGFEWTSMDIDIVDSMLKIYQKEYRDECGLDFIIPPSKSKNNPWSSYMCGFPLGKYAQEYEMFCFNMSEAHEDTFFSLTKERTDSSEPLFPKHLILQAIRRFKEIHGHLDIPLRFIVPKMLWPSGTNSMPLGFFVNVFRIQFHILDEGFQSDLLALGFSVEPPSSTTNQTDQTHGASANCDVNNVTNTLPSAVKDVPTLNTERDSAKMVNCTPAFAVHSASTTNLNAPINSAKKSPMSNNSSMAEESSPHPPTQSNSVNDEEATDNIMECTEGITESSNSDVDMEDTSDIPMEKPSTATTTTSQDTSYASEKDAITLSKSPISNCGYIGPESTLNSTAIESCGTTLKNISVGSSIDSSACLSPQKKPEHSSSDVNIISQESDQSQSDIHISTQDNNRAQSDIHIVTQESSQSQRDIAIEPQEGSQDDIQMEPQETSQSQSDIHNVTQESDHEMESNENESKVDMTHETSNSSAITTEKLLLAIKYFYSIHCHILIPRNFIVPKNDKKWPESIWGLQLGAIWKDALCGNSRQSQVSDKALSMGLNAYQAMTGHTNISANFTIPSGSFQWPHETWNFELGAFISRERPPQSASFFTSNYVKEIDWSKCFLAISMHKSVFGHAKISASFIVPLNDWSWPECLWGYNLGESIHEIQTGRVLLEPATLDKLLSLGLNLTA